MSNYMPLTKVRPMADIGAVMQDVLKPVVQNETALQKNHQPRQLAADNKAAMATISALMASYNMEAVLPDHELRMLVEACRRFDVTIAELEDAYWKAYADKFTGKRMYFRHLWTHIQEERERNDVSLRKQFTFPQVCTWLETRNLPLDYGPYFDFHRTPDGNKFYTLKPEMYDGR